MGCRVSFVTLQLGWCDKLPICGVLMAFESKKISSSFFMLDLDTKRKIRGPAFSQSPLESPSVYVRDSTIATCDSFEVLLHFDSFLSLLIKVFQPVKSIISVYP
ncbi:hypothetical protein AVEN_70400-1 [Araneus ventricosus]|uniref:Uncharacterized protein n=1 Tax=Araneus ventricosus TaxID=182803 RepID=A0A4Y2TQY0_ARAVE|nr:hypothetical protein AVEN_70400-1 [Araneus ventricosus]